MAITDAIGGVISGLLSKGPVSAPDLSALFQTIDSAGAQQRDWINALPPELQQQYANYQAANATAGTTLQTGINTIGQTLQNETAANYDPNAPAVKAAENAAKTSVYANVPSQQNAIRQALAATGGFGRGTAAKQLAAPVLQAGQQLNQATENITASQLQQKQAAIQAAFEKVTAMNDATLNSLFGMSKDQATAILNGNRQDLKDQLASLVNQSQTQTNQTLGVEGANITNQYNQQVAQNEKDNNLTNSWINLGTDAAAAAPGFLSGLGTDATSFNPNTMSVAPEGFNPYSGFVSSTGVTR